jgi:hypothetical protein
MHVPCAVQLEALAAAVGSSVAHMHEHPTETANQISAQTQTKLLATTSGMHLWEELAHEPALGAWARQQAQQQQQQPQGAQQPHQPQQQQQVQAQQQVSQPSQQSRALSQQQQPQAAAAPGLLLEPVRVAIQRDAAAAAAAGGRRGVGASVPGDPRVARASSSGRQASRTPSQPPQAEEGELPAGAAALGGSEGGGAGSSGGGAGSSGGGAGAGASARPPSPLLLPWFAQQAAYLGPELAQQLARAVAKAAAVRAAYEVRQEAAAAAARARSQQQQQGGDAAAAAGAVLLDPEDPSAVWEASGVFLHEGGAGEARQQTARVVCPPARTRLPTTRARRPRSHTRTPVDTPSTHSQRNSAGQAAPLRHAV